MKKFYFALAFVASAAMASGTPLSLRQIQEGWRCLEGVSQTSVKVKPVAAWMPGQTRSADNPQTSFEATSAWHLQARVYNLSGVATGTDNLPAGIYLVSVGDKTHKIVVK